MSTAEHPTSTGTASDSVAVDPIPTSRIGTALFHLGRARRDVVAAVLERRGWSYAVLPYPGYGVDGRARVLARVVLAAPGREPSSVRGVAAWRRLVTLQRSRVDIEVAVPGSGAGAGTVHRVRSGPGGLVDVVLPCTVEPGTHAVTFRVGERPPVQAPVHVADPHARTGIVCDIDDTALVTGLRRPLSAAWRTLTRAFAQRAPVEGMADLLTAFHEEHGGDDGPVVYLSTGPWNFNEPLTRFLQRNGFPAGPLLQTDWGPSSEGFFREGRAHKRRSLQRLRADFPEVRWLLVGDDGRTTRPSTRSSPASTRSTCWPSRCGRSAPTSAPTPRAAPPGPGSAEGRFPWSAERTGTSCCSVYALPPARPAERSPGVPSPRTGHRGHREGGHLLQDLGVARTGRFLHRDHPATCSGDGSR
ncbi:phosphatase domain-containing protein [Kineococcus radiotolerans]|uniref:Phosphatidate phosphatase APP1 catalytic domain-containing protein n=1 Tax=Kineococcus radiotolerans (strain ATCC BAA-149 / DSM 14245 / SRS30216) TaxID=266940 RepID=A6W9U7_KINRD|nr:phosphatase domain-containing protein [Kineococcus radiotolerans]ABS03586.1 conserved hypothetical protein [Kineococcus radiotolerans SRS30216 = ATCC BAA-149]